MDKLSNAPYKGCLDYLPEDFKKLEYIFSKWREVCLKFAYKEYLTPVLERAEIYEAKSGEDIKKELFTLTDNGGRRLSLRPEMTPSVTRLVTQIYNKEVKPIRYFSIANFFRGERPQKGRNREFWQVNADIFGESSINADLEIVLMAVEMMEALNAPSNSYVLKLNNRKLIDFLFTNVVDIQDSELKAEVTRKMDKFAKLSREDFETSLKSLDLTEEQVRNIIIWMTFELEQLESQFPEITENAGYQETKFILEHFNKLNLGDRIKYSADLIRGFDYYDGVVFEVFDLDPRLIRAMFGGGRYNGLASLFGSESFPASGFAAGDAALSIFLDNWNLWPDFTDSNTYFLPLILEENIDKYIILAHNLRRKGWSVELGTSITNISKALTYANKKGISKVVIYAEEEIENSRYKIKDMKSGEETYYSIDSNE